MKEIRELSSKLNETLKDISQKELSEIGYKASQDFISALDEIKKEAFNKAANMFVGITRDERGRFVSKNNVEFSVTDIARIATTINGLTDKVYDVSHVLSINEKFKSELAKELRPQLLDIIDERKEPTATVKNVEELKNNTTDKDMLDRYDSILNISREKLEELDQRERKLREDVDKLENGGKLDIVNPGLQAGNYKLVSEEETPNYDKIIELEDRLNEVFSSVKQKNMSEVGIKELRELNSILDKIKEDAFTEAANILVGLTRDEKGRFVSKNNVEYNIADIAKTFTAIDQLTDNIYNIGHVIATEQKSKEIQLDAKWELFKKNRENKREANKQIRIHENLKQNVTDNRIIAICDDIINLKKEELESIDIKEVELREEMRILLNGGKLKSLVDEEKLLEEKPLEESKPEEKPVEEVINAFPDLQIPNGELPPEPTNEEANQFPPLTPPSDEPDIRENEPLLSNEEADESEDNKEESEDKEEAIIPLPGNDAEREATFKDAKPKLKEKVKDVLEKVAPWLMTFVTIAALTIGTISDSIKPKDNIEDIRPPVIEQTVTVDQEPPLEDISDMSNVTENKDEIVSEENETPVQEESVVDTNEVHPKTDNEFYLAPGDFVAREDKETGDIESTVDYYGTQRDGEGNEIGTAEVDKTPGNYTVIEREDVPTEEETQSINNSDIEFFTNSYWEGMFGTSDETQGKSK